MSESFALKRGHDGVIDGGAAVAGIAAPEGIPPVEGPPPAVDGNEVVIGEDSTAPDAAAADDYAAQPSPAKKRRITKKRAKTKPWNDMLYQLLLFRVKNGHCRVPGSKGSLGSWVVQQRQQYHALKAKQAQEDSKPAAEPSDKQDEESKRKSQALTEERIAVLNTIDFVWDVVQFDNDVRWNQKYEELKEFVRINGHAVVPQSTPLGQWVKMQRENKKESDLKVAGMLPKRAKPRPCLSKEREQKLEAIGFQWRVAKAPVGWERRYEQLVEYRRIHGDCNVPQSYPPDKSFGRWVMKQRCEYSLKLRSLKSQLTDEREARLDAIGFSWVAPNFKRKTVPADDLGDDVIGREEATIALLAGTNMQAMAQM